jgi:hypothetical protein
MNNSKKSKKLNKENTRKSEEEMEVDSIVIESRVKSELSEKLYFYVSGIKIQNIEVKR